MQLQQSLATAVRVYERVLEGCGMQPSRSGKNSNVNFASDGVHASSKRATPQEHAGFQILDLQCTQHNRMYILAVKSRGYRFRSRIRFWAFVLLALQLSQIEAAHSDLQEILRDMNETNAEKGRMSAACCFEQSCSGVGSFYRA